MTDQFKGEDSHISIAMPDGETCRAFFPFQVYSTEDGGEIVRFSWDGVNKLTDAIEAHLKGNRLNQLLTDLPHSPERTQMRSIDL
jgi:hypothetical protein